MIQKKVQLLVLFLSFLFSSIGLSQSNCWSQVKNKIQQIDQERDHLYRQITRGESGIYDRQGSIFLEGTNPHTLVLLHGYPSFPRHFAGLAKILNEKFGYTIYVPLLSGLGGAAKVGNNVTLEDWRNDVESSLNLVRPCSDKVSLVAHSMGGGLAIDSLFNPVQAQIESVALICPMVKPQTSLGRILAAIVRTFGIKTFGPISTKLVKQVFRIVDNIKDYWKHQPRNLVPTFISTTMEDKVLKPDMSYNFPLEKMNVVDSLIYQKGSNVGHNEIITTKNPDLENLATRLDQFFQKY